LRIKPILSGGRLFSKRKIILGIGAGLLVLAVSLPFLAGTSTYPIAVVDGNSMYPTLQNGDLVFFTVPSGPIQNGTIIVFVQQRSGIPAFDSMLQQVLIHRVISVGHEPNGVADYQTKGDNNQATDPFVTDAPNVIGVPAVVVPYAGFPILFAKSAYGMVSIVAMVSLYFFAGIDTKLEEDDEKRRLIAVFARRALNGEISAAQFERLKLAAEYYDDLPVEVLTDPTMVSMVDWLKSGGLERDWKEEPQVCRDCGGDAFCITAGDMNLVVCPRCTESRSRGNPAAEY
jgi:signal peptidase I